MRTAMNVLEVLDQSGHIEFTWTPGDADSEDKARAEFDRLKAAGFAFFTEPGDEGEEVTGWSKRGRQPAWRRQGRLDVRADDGVPQPVREFSPTARRTVAVRPMVGG